MLAKIHRFVLAGAFLIALSFTLACRTQPEDTENGSAAARLCPITTPPDPSFVPPDNTPDAPPDGLFWYGTPKLWTALPTDGLWSDLPEDEHGFTQKTVWWRENYVAFEETQPDLTVSGRQLDGPGSFRQETPATHGVNPDSGQFMLAGIVIPEPGCWEITGHYRDQTLSFVIEVAR